MKKERRILIVEEDSCLSNRLRSILVDAKVSITTTNICDEDLVGMLLKIRTDLVILNRPSISGLEISQMINIRRLVDVPVIMVSSRKIFQNEIETVRFPDQIYKITTMTLDQLKAWICILIQKMEPEVQLPVWSS